MPILQPDINLKDIGFEASLMHVSLTDGRVLSVPLEWFPKLANAEKEKLQNWESCAGGQGIHWEALDEDLGLEGLLRGVH